MPILHYVVAYYICSFLLYNVLTCAYVGADVINRCTWCIYIDVKSTSGTRFSNLLFVVNFFPLNVTRSYYRCSNTGCPVKKHVERDSHDPKVVITTYEGQHDHTVPSARMVTHNTSGADTNVTPQNGKSRSETEEKEAAGLDMVVHVGANE